MAPPKILYVITKANWGGAQRYVYDLAVAAQDRGYPVAVLVGGTGPLTERLAAAGVRTVSLPLRQRATFIGDLLTFGPLFSLIRILRAERPAIVHVNSAKAGGLGAVAARLTGVPRIIFTAHGWEFNAPRGRLSKIGIRFFSWLTILLAHETIAVSDAIRRDVATWPFVGKRLTVIRNGIECVPLLARDQARAALPLGPDSGVWIGMLSELNPTKRVEDAIEAFSLIALRHPDTHLIVMGEGRERAALERLIAARGLAGRAHLVGFVADARRYLNAFDLFLHTSESEALGYALLEAGCAALPTVATRVGGIPEIIEHGVSGLLVPSRAPEKAAAALETLLAAPEQRAALGPALQEHVRNAFSREHMVRETFALYTA